MTIGPAQIRQFCLCTASHAADCFSPLNPFCSCSLSGTHMPAPLRLELAATRQAPSFTSHPVPQQVQRSALCSPTAFVSAAPPYTQQKHIHLFPFHWRLLRQGYHITDVQSLQLCGVQHRHAHYTRVEPQPQISAAPEPSHRPRRACVEMVEEAQQLPPVCPTHHTTQHPQTRPSNS